MIPMQKKQIRTISLAGLLLLVSACSGEAPQTKEYPEAGSTAASLYLLRCGDCHVAPQPSAHKAQAWPSILQRMQMRMKAKARTPLSKEELSMVLDYVQRHARVDN